jgi:hypothetical protein
MRHAKEFTWPEFVQRGSPLAEDPAPDLRAGRVAMKWRMTG